VKFDNLIPLLIIGLFFIGIIMVGKIASKKVSNSDDYLVAGRGAPLLLIVGTVFATFWGGGTIIGATGSAYNSGIFGVIEDPFAAGLALILIGVFFVKILRKLRIRSIGELYNYRFGSTTGYFASAVMIPTYVIWTAVQFLAIGKILNVLFGINFTISYIVAIIVVVIFTYMGGIMAVVWTDFIQMIIILIGLISILIIGTNAAGGIDAIIQNTPEGYWNFLPSGKGIRPWITYLAMWVGMGLGNIPSPDIAQRAFMAKDGKTAKRGMIIAGGLYWTIGFIPVILALIGITLVNQGVLEASLLSEDSELLIPFLAKQLLGPVGLGVFVSSLISAILSSASTSLFATAVLCSNDIYKPIMTVKVKEENIKKEDQMLKITRMFVILVGLLAAICGLASSNIYDLTIFAFTLQFGVLFFPFVMALKSKRVNTYGVIAGMIGGLLVNIGGCISQLSIIPEPWEFYTLIPALVNLILIVTVSYMTRNKNAARPLEDIYLEN
jgi:SSS family transporter